MVDNIWTPQQVRKWNKEKVWTEAAVIISNHEMNPPTIFSGYLSICNVSTPTHCQLTGYWMLTNTIWTRNTKWYNLIQNIRFTTMCCHHHVLSPPRVVEIIMQWLSYIQGFTCCKSFLMWYDVCISFIALQCISQITLIILSLASFHMGHI